MLQNMLALLEQISFSSSVAGRADPVRALAEVEDLSRKQIENLAELDALRAEVEKLRKVLNREF